MNQTIKDILSRRSTRAFKDEQIGEDALKQIIEAGLYAPSAHNQQSWHFTVIQNAELLEELNIKAKEIAKTIPDELVQKMANNEKLNIFYNSPTVIIISGEESAMMPQVDCTAATQNILIAAESLGISSCWIGFIAIMFNSPQGAEYKEKLGIPDGYKPYHAVALGYSKNESAEAPKRRESTISYFK